MNFPEKGLELGVGREVVWPLPLYWETVKKSSEDNIDRLTRGLSVEIRLTSHGK